MFFRLQNGRQMLRTTIMLRNVIIRQDRQPKGTFNRRTLTARSHVRHIMSLFTHTRHRIGVWTRRHLLLLRIPLRLSHRIRHITSCIVYTHIIFVRTFGSSLYYCIKQHIQRLVTNVPSYVECYYKHAYT